MQTSDVVGSFLLEELAKLRDEFEIIGDVRGKGLMIGMELVKSKVTYIMPFNIIMFINFYRLFNNLIVI